MSLIIILLFFNVLIALVILKITADKIFYDVLNLSGWKLDNEKWKGDNLGWYSSDSTKKSKSFAEIE